MISPYKSHTPDIHKTAYVAPTAVIIGRACLKESASIWFNTVVRADINAITIGAGSNIQDSCTLHVTDDLPVVVGDRVTVGHGAIIHGCTIENDCLIAMGAVILDGAVIGTGSVVAAGAVVSPGMKVPPGSLVMGLPAKVKRQVTEADRRLIDSGWRNYTALIESYREMHLEATVGD